MQVWPRKRAKNITARVRAWFPGKETKLLGFAGYKAGMTHVITKDPKKARGGESFVPVTIIECPPLKTASIRFYKKNPYGMFVVGEIFAQNLDKELARTICLPKKQPKNINDIKDFDDIRLLVYTQPKLTCLPKKKPEIFELGIGGSKEEKLKLAQEKLGKEITIKEVFKEGEQVDTHSVTKGKGYQGPVRRFGVTIRSHKAEKTKRGPASLGPWCGQGHIMYRVAHAGQMGFHTRMEYNKVIVKIGEKPEEIKINGGIMHYGFVKNNYILLKGSIGGPNKRIIRLTKARRINKKYAKEVPQIKYVSLESKQ